MDLSCLAQIDVFEINEAFAAQAVYCVRKLSIPMHKVNPLGGSNPSPNPSLNPSPTLTLTLTLILTPTPTLTLTLTLTLNLTRSRRRRRSLRPSLHARCAAASTRPHP